jgi:hypothetical protein
MSNFKGLPFDLFAFCCFKSRNKKQENRFTRKREERMLLKIGSEKFGRKSFDRHFIDLFFTRNTK